MMDWSDLHMRIPYKPLLLTQDALEKVFINILISFVYFISEKTALP